MVRLGEKGVLDLKIGDTGAKRAYLGDVQVWPGYHYLEFWTEAHPVEDMDSWMDGTSDSGLYCVTEDVETFMKSLREYPDMTAIYDATGDRTIPVIPTDGGATVSTMASRDGEVGTCYINTDLGSVANVYVGSSVVGYAFIAGIAWSDDGTNRQVAWGWLIDADIEGTATFTRGSETHTVTKAGLYLPRATVGFSGSDNKLVTREYGVEEYAPLEWLSVMIEIDSETVASGWATQESETCITIDWGDGTVETPTGEPYVHNMYKFDFSHTFAAGTYTVRFSKPTGASGIIRALQFGNDSAHYYDPIAELDARGGNFNLLKGGAGIHALYTGDSSVGQGLYSGCTALETVEFGQPQSIEYLAFDGCSALGPNLEIPAQYVSIFAFRGCTSLRKVWIRETVTQMGDDVFYGTSPDLVVYCEADAQPATWNTPWSETGSGTTATVVWGQKTSPF